MHLRTIISGALALLLLSGAGALSQESHGSTHTIPMPQTSLPGVFGSKGNSQGFRVAQAGDPRITELEERIRQMSGTIEELNFQVLQMQEQLRKMQEDNEFRFQQLEQKKSGARTGDASQSVATAEPSAPAVVNTPAATPEEAAPTEAATTPGAVQPGRGEPPKSMGTIVFDSSGNVTGGSIGDKMSAGAAPTPGHAGEPAAADGEQVAALPATDDPDELYRNAYEFILSGDYKTAEAGFRDHIARFPADPKTPDARFWLGESLLSQHKYRDAAEIFLAASKDYPNSKKGPEMLLKLGVSLAGLKQRDVACATFTEIGKRYPSTSQQLKERVKKEQAATGC